MALKSLWLLGFLGSWGGDCKDCDSNWDRGDNCKVVTPAGRGVLNCRVHVDSSEGRLHVTESQVDLNDFGFSASQPACMDAKVINHFERGKAKQTFLECIYPTKKFWVFISICT